MQNFITINGHQYPQPGRGLILQSATLVDSARNANGVVVGQVVGRPQQKIDSLVWPYLTAEMWASICQEFEPGFYVTVTFPDMVHNTWTTRKMYPGDRSAEVFDLKPSGLPAHYINCKVNIIDCGE